MHRYRRTRPPLLVRGGAAAGRTERLLALLKPLLRAELAPLVEAVDEPRAVLRALWDATAHRAAAAAGGAPTPPPPPLPPPAPPEAEVEERRQAAQARLCLPSELRHGGGEEGGLVPQWRRRDALALLLSREAVGHWAPNGLRRRGWLVASCPA